MQQYIKKGYCSGTLICDIRPMKVRIRDDMKVPRGLEATCYTRGRKKKRNSRKPKNYTWVTSRKEQDTLE